MTALTAAKKRYAGTWRPRDAAGWVGLAASPAFALMAGIAAADGPRMAVCSPVSVMPPVDAMAWMYLLMSLFHVPPWLKFVFPHPKPEGQ